MGVILENAKIPLEIEQGSTKEIFYHGFCLKICLRVSERLNLSEFSSDMLYLFQEYRWTFRKNLQDFYEMFHEFLKDV